MSLDEDGAIRELIKNSKKDEFRTGHYVAGSFAIAGGTCACIWPSEVFGFVYYEFCSLGWLASKVIDPLLYGF